MKKVNSVDELFSDMCPICNVQGEIECFGSDGCIYSCPKCKSEFKISTKDFEPKYMVIGKEIM